jgi:DNA-binding IclR family transcriptional regulator
MARRNAGRTVQSDDTLFDIVEFIRDRDRVGVTDIATELDIAKSTVHAHLTTLSQRGYVVNDDGEYRIGLQFLRHGIHAQTSNDLYSIAKKKVTQLAQQTGERAWCHVEENGVAYYLCGAEGEHPVRPPVQVGEWVHLHQISGGKAILAHLPEERTREIIDRYGLPAKTEHTITDEATLFETLDGIRQRGYAFNEEESLRGLHAVGAPVREADGPVRGALSVSGPANRLTGEKFREELPELLLGATNELEINITYS